MVNIEEILLLRRVADQDIVSLHRHFRQSSIFKGQDCSQEKGINQIPVIIQELHLNRKTPCQFTLHNTQTLPISGPRLLENFVNETLDLYAHLRYRVCLLVEFCRVSQSHEVNVYLHLALVRLAWARSDYFQHALCHNFGLAKPHHDLTVFSPESDLIDESEGLLAILLD